MSMIEKALDILERHLGPNHPELAASLTNLANAHSELRHFETAERLQQRALAIDEKVFGANHPNIAFSLMNLAFLAWESRRDCDFTLEHVRRVKAILGQHYSPDHPKLEETSEFLMSVEEQCTTG